MTRSRFLALLTALTATNLVLLAGQLVRARSVIAGDAPAVLRGRALEIVDDEGRVRASIRLHEAAVQDGKSHPGTVALRLFDVHGRPGVKMTTAEGGGAGLLVLTASDSAYIRLDSGGPEPNVTISAAGRERILGAQR